MRYHFTPMMKLSILLMLKKIAMDRETFFFADSFDVFMQIRDSLDEQYGARNVYFE